MNLLPAISASCLILAHFNAAAQVHEAEGFGNPAPFASISELVPADSRQQARPPSISLVDIHPTRSMAEALANVRPDAPGTLRGVREVKLYRSVSPAVVLIASESGSGSGSLLNSGEILTNWHVVAEEKEVGVIFKPAIEGRALTRADVRRARVVRVDQVADLAILRLLEPVSNVTPIELGSLEDAMVGADVHAIGHPTGQSWTYTKGVVSQIRRDFKWTSEDKKAHQATVVQTQTPINPGNSGGPLLTDEGRLIGVNSFKSAGEGLNFAVSVDEVRRFLQRTSDRVAAEVQSKRAGDVRSQCSGEPVQLYSGRSKQQAGTVVGFDLDCDKKADLEIRTPDGQSSPILWVFDKNKDGKPDMIAFDYKRTSFFELSFHDIDFDGKWDLVGYHKDGELKAVRYAPYDQAIAKR